MSQSYINKVRLEETLFIEINSVCFSMDMFRHMGICCSTTMSLADEFPEKCCLIFKCIFEPFSQQILSHEKYPISKLKSYSCPNQNCTKNP